MHRLFSSSCHAFAQLSNFQLCKNHMAHLWNRVSPLLALPLCMGDLKLFYTYI